MDGKLGQKDIKEMGYIPTIPGPIPPSEFNCLNNRLPNGEHIGRPILFSSNSSKIDREGLMHLEQLKSQIQGTNRPVYVVGFTDDVGSSANNQVLSEKRAEAVAKHLGKNALPKGCGEKPYGNDTPEGRSNNRTVEVWWR
jgi:outer membrane protein OmpA-like peptidoglycan-associated protein